ncbi:hypothetical protein P8452_53475 [Trifolium repens]|jgi:hypothetical protein|nr:hypothetical protein QL285_034866 [Trifolium repens]WJX69193.1 hypothetical protein P8452_53475 [Trifolium repens]
MNSKVSRAAWTAAASVGVVEALKDQGICRWNHTLKSVNNHLKNNVRSFSQANKLSSSSSSAMVSNSSKQKENAKQSEESLRTVMYLSCWGPN